ncbi:ribosome biogenesis GTPase YlqF [Lusitaniella coriacea LEGE 07157]|uniref:Ribosome biogenesis GTPase A n=1 Tax=Lusitaniella coriacea LEGE 07157 TaxID=945747 RepID=A0A8J7DY42_9CYAN|nr:ribosome biogenesis GTPase YlqF [Lusitaniella coriacea]MBE9117496.1 ribosome biogenesis GTPase YlqF [Lusitaniella coriacea LEGE 07157]
MSSPPIQWYPGHIAKAERQLKEQLKRVDVVLEVLDARIPLASQHPDVARWISHKPKVLVLNRVDAIPASLRREWTIWFESQGQMPYFTNAKQGKGIQAVAKAARGVKAEIDRRRRDRGMRPRSVRAVVIGMPNVGKSALINRLVGRKTVKSERRAGVTRQLHWVRISDSLDLLDAPGVIPWRLDNQTDALKLAICEDIGAAAYDNQIVAAAFIDLLVQVGFAEVLKSRYQLDPLSRTGEEYLYDLAHMSYRGDLERVAMLLLNDFRKGSMGAIPLEFPPQESN